MFKIKAIRNWSRSHAAQLRLVRLLTALILLGCATTTLLLASWGRLGWAQIGQAQGSTTRTPPHAASAFPPPSDIQVVQESSQSSTSTPGRHVFIGFDGLPYDFQFDPDFDYVPLSYALPANQYPDIVFSSTPGYHVATYGRYYGTPVPGITRASDFNNYANHVAPLIVDFPKPVSDLTFVLTGADTIGPIAALEIYQNGIHTRTESVFANGYHPVTQSAASTYTNVTRIVVNKIIDPYGIGFDNFSFTVQPVATPTPTPSASPTPTPPPAPTNVKATPDEEQIFVSWTPSQGAGWYTIKRGETSASTSGAGSESLNFVASESLSLVPVNPSFYCDGVSVPCVYDDPNLNSDIMYSYVVAAVNNSGASADSNPPASTKPLPKPGCKASATPTPPQGPASGFGWTMNYSFSDRDGLVISDVYLNGKRMAKQMSVPYFWITTFTAANSNLIRTRGELTPAGTSSSMRSRLVNYKINPSDPNKILIEADYAIDRIPGTPKACLNITQKYEFYRAGASPADLTGPCEPSDTVTPCNKFRPMIQYSFHGENGEFLSSLNTPIRLHFQNTVTTGNTVALTRDFDDPREMISPAIPFKSVFNPLMNSWWSQVIVPRSPQHPDKNANTVDNFHQTNDKISVILPGLKVWRPSRLLPPVLVPRLAGCPECVHFHWRWSSFVSGPNFRDGIPMVPPGSDQAVDIQVVPFKNNFENFHPTDYFQLFNPIDPLRNPTKGVKEPYDVVFWYSPTGFAASDSFFWHTAWFTPKKLQDSNEASVEQVSSNSSNSTVQDGPVSVIFGSVYETGNTTFDSYDLSTLPVLPPGYAALNNAAYLIDTTGVVSGPHVVNFSVGSISDQSTFDNLRIFYAEPDPFDPEKPMWFDATILSPDSPSPNFPTKTLSARSERLGVFVIGKLVQTVPVTVANLRIVSTDSSDPVTAGNNLTYTFTVTNDGPQGATEVALKDILSPDVHFISVACSQGICKEIDGVVYCSLNSLLAGTSATITIVGQPTEGTGSFPPEGKMIANTAITRAKEGDSDATNDSVTEATRVLPNPNNPPLINITAPVAGAMLVGPVNLTISAAATDTDGSITKVDFFDNDELIGSGVPGAGNIYSITQFNVPYGNHSLIAVATDSGGRQNVSSTVDVIVNGSATVNVTSPPSGILVNPGSNITLGAIASHPSGFLSKVEFFSNGQLIGEGAYNGSGQYSFAWGSVNGGNYSIVAVATDGSGITTTSAPVNVTVDSPPTVNMSTPADGAVFPTLTNISVSATAQSAAGEIMRVDFYANGIFIGSANDVGTDKFTATWRHLADGLYSLKAVATDNLGVSTTSPGITIGVNTQSPRVGEFVWFDDSVPLGAAKHADGDVDWYWVDANPGSFSGTKAHQSRNSGPPAAPSSSSGGSQLCAGEGWCGPAGDEVRFHQHYFDAATLTLPINAGDKLFTYVFLDINNLPREIMLQWKDSNGWEHRAYWGQDRINLGINGTNSRRYMGPIPTPARWVRLEVPASAVGLEGSTLNGMAFTLDAGRATWDLTGKATANAATPPVTPPGDSVWIEDGLPPGSATSGVDDVWNWVVAPVNSGQSAHQSYFNNNDVVKYRSHSFTGAQTPMQVNPGDVLFTYVYLGDPDPNHQPFTPDQIMLQWFDGTSWEHRAFWGENYIGQQVPSIGVQGTESQRYMGGLPAARGWYRLEVPASYVGLEGKSVSGMAFSTFRNGKNPFVSWDRAGKSSQLTTMPLALSATTGVWRLFSNTHGYSFETNDQGSPEHFPQKKDVFYVHPNQAAGTVPMYRFRRPTNYEYFYARDKQYYETHGWQYEGIGFYVYPDATTPGTVPLYLYHDTQFHYFLTTDQNEAEGLSMYSDGTAPWAFVLSVNPLQPGAPSSLRWDGIWLRWTDNSATETGFKLEGSNANGWSQIGTIAANTTFFKLGSLYSSYDYFRVRATNTFGDSAYSNSTCACWEYYVTSPNTAPDVSIISPGDGNIVGRDFTITANAFDIDGNGLIVKVEFFANGIKLGEVADAPYIFVWSNIAPGTYSLTAVAKDTAGATTTSAPLSVTVPKFGQSITFNALSGRTYGDTPFTVSASSSSGLPVNFSIVSGQASISDSTVTITGVGTVIVRAAQTGNGDYNAATPVDRDFVVGKASATIALSNLNQTYNGSPRVATATTTPTAISGVSITYNNSSTAPTNVGSYSVAASLINDNYTPVIANDFLVITKATPTIAWNNPADIFSGTVLGVTQLNAVALFNGSSVPGVFSYSPALGTVLSTTGSNQLQAMFTPSDSANFSGVANVNAYINVLPAPYKSLALNGTNKYMNVPNSSSLNITGSVTLEAWIKTNSNTTYQSIIERYGAYPGTNDGGYILRLTNTGKVQFATLRNAGDADFLYGATTITTGVWHHVAGMFDGTQMRIYLDGVLDASKASTFAPITGTTNVRIGITGQNNTLYPFNGLIDEARVSATAVYTANFAPQTNLTSNANTRGLWKFDGQTPNDFSGNSNNGTPVNNPSYSADIPGAVLNSLSLNGTNQYMNVPNSSSLNITGSVTLEAWIKTNSNTTYQSIIERYGAYPGTNDGGYILRLTNTGKVQFATLRNAGDADFLYGATTITTGVWHHVAGVFDGTQMRIYLDGVLNASKASTFAPVTGVTDVRIGITGQNNTLFPFNGLIDEARVSAAAVYTANFSPQTNLNSNANTRGLWKFDGQSTSDFSGNSNNGTLANGASYSTTVP